MTDEQVLTAVAERWAISERFNARRVRILGVTAHDVAPRLGGPVRSVAPRLARLAREGRLTRVYDERAGDAGAFVYRPAP